MIVIWLKDNSNRETKRLLGTRDFFICKCVSFNGGWAFQINPTAEDLLINHLAMNFPDATIEKKSRSKDQEALTFAPVAG